MTEPVYLGIDLGTQSVRVLAVTGDGHVAASASMKLGRSVCDGIRHEQDPEEWWLATCACLRGVIKELGAQPRVEGLAVDATSGTILLCDDTRRALTAGLMYDDGRAREEAVQANAAGADLWSDLSYRMQPSWALPKLMWILRNTDAPSGARLAHQNDFINARLAGHWLATDSSHALKTGYDLYRSEWPTNVMEAAGIPNEILPDVVAPGTQIGEVGHEAAEATGLAMGVPIIAGMTDGCAAQIASGATGVGRWNTVIGTTMVLKGVTRELLRDPLGVVYSHRSMDGFWLPGGASSTGAAAIAKEFDASDLNALNEAARAGPTSVVVYPLMSKGERFPFAAPNAEGFTLGEPAGVEEKYRAVLQGIAMLERLSFEILEALGAETGGRLSISGGAVNSGPLNQIRADVLERELVVPAVTEGAFGMAVLVAATQSSMAAATQRMVRIAQTVSPARSFEEYSVQYERFVGELSKRGWLAPAALPSRGVQ